MSIRGITAMGELFKIYPKMLIGKNVFWIPVDDGIGKDIYHLFLDAREKRRETKQP